MRSCLGHQRGAGALNAAVHVAQAHILQRLHAVVHPLWPQHECLQVFAGAEVSITAGALQQAAPSLQAGASKRTATTLPQGCCRSRAELFSFSRGADTRGHVKRMDNTGFSNPWVCYKGATSSPKGCSQPQPGMLTFDLCREDVAPEHAPGPWWPPRQGCAPARARAGAPRPPGAAAAAARRPGCLAPARMNPKVNTTTRRRFSGSCALGIAHIESSPILQSKGLLAQAPRTIGAHN